MSLLFDISPLDSPEDGKKRKGKKAKGVATGSPEAKPPEIRYTELRILGQTEGQCCNPKCGATFFDIIDDYKGEWLIECAFCGWQQRMPAVPGVLPADETFIFPDGPFIGMTLAQASVEANGTEFIRWYATKHKSETVRTACQSWVSAVGYPATQGGDSDARRDAKEGAEDSDPQAQH